MKKLFVLIAAGVIALNVSAQEPGSADTTSPSSNSNVVFQELPFLSNAYSRTLPINRTGSGTAWLPDASPMYAYISATTRSNWTIQGNIVLRYNKQDVFNKASRGAPSQGDFPNWFMGRYNRKVGSRGLVNVTAMISFDALTVGKRGYPLLFQSGQTYNGERLVDRQHPRDLFAGLSLAYTHMFNQDVDVTLYAGYPGEPAFGPTSFMNRISSLNNPNAPLGWQDAMHTVYGVGTLGIRYKKFKLEGSVFTGREPDDDRFNFDEAKFDSYSYRLSFNPNPHWAVQFSQGYLNAPKTVEPGVDQVRTTASLIRSTSLRTMNWSQTLSLGMNDKSDQDNNEYSVLYETNLQFQRQALYARYEFLKRTAEELNIQPSHEGQAFNINALTLGYNFNISPAAPLDVLLGVQGTLNFPGAGLKSIYGSLPLGAQVYIQLRPRRHRL